MVATNVEFGASVVTDEFAGYRGLSSSYHHQTVNHSAGEYAHTGNWYHTNGIESVWSLLKRQIIGIHHWVSPKHLHRYVGEMAWRYNRRERDEGQRVNDMLAWSDGRLTYKALIA